LPKVFSSPPGAVIVQTGEKLFDADSRELSLISFSPDSDGALSVSSLIRVKFALIRVSNSSRRQTVFICLPVTLLHCP
jgi:hypothetical protein